MLMMLKVFSKDYESNCSWLNLKTDISVNGIMKKFWNLKFNQLDCIANKVGHE